MLAAVILAAGTGSRLHPLTARGPKTLVEVGLGGETILDRLLGQIADCGIETTYIVTGYRHDAIERHIEKSSRAGAIRLVFNPEFDTLNNARSLFAVRDMLEGRAFAKFDGDLVLDPNLLPLLVRSGSETATLVDFSKSLVDEDMKVQVSPESGLVSAFGKHLPNSSDGVSIGLERVGESHSALVFDAIERLIHAYGRGDGYYEDAYQLVLSQGLEMKAVSTEGLPWQEVDNLKDLEAARRMLSEGGAGRS